MIVLKSTPKNIIQAAQVLRAGGIIVYPTDTAYALGGVFNSSAVVKKILKIKKRQDDKFTIVAASPAQVQKFFKLNSAQKKLARQFWPGPLSIVVSTKLSVRVPANTLTRRLCRLVGRPLIATSANVAGGNTPYGSRQIINDFKNEISQPDLLLDGGHLARKKTSTIVKAEKNNLIIIRQGSVKITDQSSKSRGNYRRPGSGHREYWKKPLGQNPDPVCCL